MQVTCSKNAQLKFGQFSRAAQKDISIVTSHGQAIFATVPVQLNAATAEFIQKVNPVPPEATAIKLDLFFQNLAKEQAKTRGADTPTMTDSELQSFIKSPN